ncbi:DUF294 nucleotidyltransferase-like domain-containing protein [Sansalvadorimonas sp. 2012CJ34-2]|uniref:DUF294 nucleotidyltransferase-like domain-containing protein n=1 Tax=Parendozoicomonas callyspongiae TaxID=2942213 RepID=A0ABT0PJI1_9GAMM|nr:DUF294 nucleotidyltransferase-like domain-containing protein [Sansalvadorimonas sp. 2012CJ34-2]MCL6270628.1 DUF294 nucleotidyltransferase-like domain-containing protein [Sansalvadorimonas sp. 2012CJ34-2]
MNYQARFQQPPFDVLTEEQRLQLIKAASLSWYKPGEKLLKAGSEAQSLMIVQKGVIEERHYKDKQKIYAHYAEDDLFDVRGLVDGKVRHEYICLEESLVQEVPAGLFLRFCEDNKAFREGLQADLSEKYHRLHEDSRPEIADFLLSRIERNHCRPAKTVSGHLSLAESVRILEDEHLDALLVDLAPSESGLGIVTRTDLLRALAIHQKPLSCEVGSIAIAPLISIELGDYLFNALLIMTQRRIERLTVFQGDELVGMMDLTQILSLASNHSHLLAMRIVRANTVDELIDLSPEIDKQARSLFSNGVRTGFVMQLVSTLNDQLLKRLFELHFPTEYQDRICLLSLGSEGRGEQVLKTDQDNALIISDGIPKPDAHILEGFTKLLLACGWPRCKGNVMVSNPHWVQTQSEWQKRIVHWMDNSNPENMMEMAMMADARAVAGNEQLMDEFQDNLNVAIGKRESFLSTFVAPALQFDTRLTFFGRIKEGRDHKMDVKKAGIFPLVHGIRSLSLEQRINARSTMDRLAALKKSGKLEADRASKLEEAFLVLNRLRLEQQIDESCDGNELDLDALDYRRRDMLRHCLHTVKKFHQYLRHHFHIDG